MTNSAADFDLYNKSEYLAQLRQRVEATRPGSRVLLMTMDFEPIHPEIASLMAALLAAAERGVTVRLGIDAHSFLADGSRLGPLWYHTNLPARLREPYRLKQTLMRQLRNHKNSQVVILNPPKRAFSLPVAGRSHIKIAIIDDYVMLGGCNLDNPAHVDLMIGWSSPAAIESLHATMLHALNDGMVRRALMNTDTTMDLPGVGRVLIDAGVRGQSLIFDEALALIDSARQWLTITCQFFPNSITARHLLTAQRRGVKLQILYTNRRQHSFIGRMGQEVSELMERARLPREMFTSQLPANGPYLHAKLIACDQGVMIGSHNYVRAGVMLGTAEIALHIPSVALAQAAAQKIHTELASAA